MAPLRPGSPGGNGPDDSGRSLTVLGEVLLESGSILRDPDEDQGRVFQKIAELLVGRLDLPLAFIGKVPPDSSRAGILAAAGPAAEIASALVDADTRDPGGHGLVGLALVSGRIQSISDMASDPSLSSCREAILRYGLGSGLADTAAARDGTRVILLLLRRESGPVPSGVARLLSGLVQEMAAFIDRRHSEAELRQVTAYQKAFLDLQESFQKIHDPRDLYRALVRKVVARTDLVGAYVLVPDPDSEWLPVAASWARTAVLRKVARELRVSRRADRPVAGEILPAIAFREKRPRGPVLPDAFHLMHRDPAKRRAIAGIREAMAFPVMIPGEKTPAAVFVVWNEECGQFFPGVQALLGQLSTNLGLILEKLRKDEEIGRLSLVARKTDGCILLTDAEGNVSWVNRAFEEKFGFTLKEILGRSPTGFRTGPESDREILETMEAQSRARQSLEETVLLYPRSAPPVWMKITGTPLGSPEEGSTAYIRVETDVTELKETEERARISALFYQALSESRERLNLAGDRPPKEALVELLSRLSGLLGAVILFVARKPRESSEVEIDAWTGPFPAWIGDVRITDDPAVAGGQGPAGRALRSGQPQVVLMTEPWLPGFMRDRAPDFGIVGSLTAIAPCENGDTILLAAHFSDRSFVDHHFVDLFQKIAGEIAGSADRTRLKNRVAQYAEFQEGVRAIQQAFLSARETRDFFEILVRTIESLTHCLAAYILVRPPGKDVLVVDTHATRDEDMGRIISGLEFPINPLGSPMDCSVSSLAYLTGRSQVQTLKAGLEVLKFARASFPQLSGVRAIMGVPVLRTGGVEPLAVLTVFSGAEDLFSPELVTLAEQLAGSLDLALERLSREKEIERLSLVARKSTESMLLTDALSRILWVNPAFEEKFGFPLSEVSGECPMDFRVGPRTDPEVLERIRDQVRNGRSYGETLVAYTRGGLPIWISVNATALAASDGGLTGYILVETDVTSIKEAEEKVRISTLFYRALSEAMERLRGGWEGPREEHLSRILGRLRELTGAIFLSLVRVMPGEGTAIQVARVEESSGSGVSGGEGADEEISASAFRGNGERILLEGQYPHQRFVGEESAALFRRIVTEMAAFFDREERIREGVRTTHYKEIHHQTLERLFSASDEPAVYRVLVEVLARESGILVVDVLRPGPDHFVRELVAGELSGVIRSLPLPPLDDPGDGKPFPTPTRVFLARKALVVDRPAEDPRMPPLFRTTPLGKVGSTAGWPLFARSEGEVPVAVVSMAGDASVDFRERFVVDLLDNLSTSASMAIDRFRILQKLEELSFRDPLTGLLNRRGFELSIGQFLASVRRNAGETAICMMDLDDFKAVNDQYGHAAGDALLKEFGERLTGTLRKTDLVGRLGGDEFFLAVAIPSPGGLDKLLSRLDEAFALPCRIPEGPDEGLTPRVSMGVALATEDLSDPDRLLRQADEALYAAKELKGRRDHWWSVWGEGRQSGRPESGERTVP